MSIVGRLFPSIEPLLLPPLFWEEAPVLEFAAGAAPLDAGDGRTWAMSGIAGKQSQSVTAAMRQMGWAVKFMG